MASPSAPENRKVAISSSAASTLSTRAVANHRKLFPQILMKVLNLTSSDPNLAEILAWNDDGTSFRILSRQGVEEIVMPQYFAALPSSSTGNKSSYLIKYASFTRRLNRWGFRRITTKGPDVGNFYHHHFRRDEPELVSLMECTKRRYGSGTEGVASSADTDGGGAAASSHPSASWSSSYVYPGTCMGTFRAPGHMQTHMPPPHVSTSEYAHMHGGTIPGAAEVAYGRQVISGSGRAYSNHYPGHNAIGHNQAAMAAAEAHHWNSTGMPRGIRPPPDSNFFGAAGRHDGASIGGANAGAGDSALHQQPPPPMMGYQQPAVSGLGSGQQQLVNEVAHHKPLSPAYLSNLEIMALARRDRAFVQYRKAAGLGLDPPRDSRSGQGRGGGEEEPHEKAEGATFDKKEGTDLLHETRADSVPEAVGAITTLSSEERAKKSGTKYEVNKA